MAKPKMTWNGFKITTGVHNAIMRGLIASANDVRNTAVESILSGPKTGLIYTTRGRTHQASAPGEPPANELGNLANSITLRIDAARMVVFVNAGAKYGAALEYGTRKMSPRPYLRPALLTHAAGVNARVLAEVRAFLASGGK